MRINSITTKLFLLLGAALSAFFIFFVSHNYSQYHTNMDKHIKQSLNLALEFDLAIRNYVATEIRPVMSKFLGPDEFMPETMSTSFVARSIFEDVQKKFPDFILKFSSNNPRNPKNLAGRDEKKIVDLFNKNPRQNRWSGHIKIKGKEHLTLFNARRVKESCLHCHGDPADAPASLIKRYGDKASFHYKVGQIIATDTVAFRHTRIKSEMAQNLRDNYPTFLLAFLGLFTLIILGLKFLVVNRIARISNYFSEIIQTGDYTQLEHLESHGTDEIDTLTQNFNHLADKLTEYHLSLDKEAAQHIRTNRQLQEQIANHHKTKAELQELYDNQEGLINKRTAELSRANASLEGKHCALEKSNQELEQAKEELEENNRQMLAKQEKMAQLFDMVEKAKHEWEITMDCINDMVIMTGPNDIIKRCNGAILKFTDKGYNEIIGKPWTDILNNGNAAKDDFSGEPVEYYHELSKRWFYLNFYWLDDSGNQVITLHDFTEQKKASQERELQNQKIQDAYAELKHTQGQLLQQEKMASIGQLAAGVAHEINNPVGFISSNLGSLGKYIERLSGFVEFQDDIIQASGKEEAINRQKEQRAKLKLDFIQKDIVELIDESQDGCKRVKKIVQDLKGFSRVDEADKQLADINECLETTLNIVWNELKYKAKVEKDYGEIDSLDCYPQQLNQVFMNLLVNAAHAITKEGIIKIKTWQDSEFLYTSIADSGTGISAENQEHIFEPFFTTKEVGKGTGLGLSIVYDIVTKNHNGDLVVDSREGEGTTFTVKIPRT